MSKKTKTWLVIATSLVVLGLLMFTAVMSANHWNFTKLSTVAYETNTYQVQDEFHSISMKTDTADIVFVKSEGSECQVVCHEEEHSKHSVTVQDGTLTINLVDEREWYEYIGITIGSSKIAISLPEKEYTSLFIKESTGDIEMTEAFAFENVDISTSTGRVNLANMTCKNVISKGSTGDLLLENVIAEEKLLIERSTGDIFIDSCDAAEIFIETDTGDVRGSLLSEKVFITKTDTGRIDIPKIVKGGKCEIETDTGDIKMKIID